MSIDLQKSILGQILKFFVIDSSMQKLTSISDLVYPLCHHLGSNLKVSLVKNCNSTAYRKHDIATILIKIQVRLYNSSI